MRSSFSRLAVAALTAVILTAIPSTASAQKPTLCVKAYGLRQAVIKKHGKRAPGRNICRYGLTNGKQPTVRKKAQYFRALKRLNASWTTLAGIGPGSPRVAPAGTATPRVLGGHLASIAACESGGRPGAVDPSGAYRGKYQFDYGTWASVGGSGDPAAASEAEQDMRAAKLYAQRGAAPWPVCGR